MNHRITNLIRAGVLPERADVPESVLAATVDPIEVNQGEWTIDEDLLLLKGATQGRGMQAIARHVGRSKTVCVARFKALVPEPSMEAQKDALKAVKAAIQKRDMV